MQIVQVATNLINRIAGRKQEFDELLASGDISQIRSKMLKQQRRCVNTTPQRTK